MTSFMPTNATGILACRDGNDVLMSDDSVEPVETRASGEPGAEKTWADTMASFWNSTTDTLLQTLESLFYEELRLSLPQAQRRKHGQPNVGTGGRVMQRQRRLHIHIVKQLFFIQQKAQKLC